MSGETTITLTFLFAIISVIGVVYSIYNSSRSNRKQDTVQQHNSQEEELKKAVKTAVEFAKINSKLDELNTTSKAIQLTLEQTDVEFKKINITINNHEQMIKDISLFKERASKKLEEHDKKIIKLESIGGFRDEN